MGRINLISGLMLGVGVLLAGCASKGFVREEVNKTRTEVTEEQNKLREEKISEMGSKLSTRMTNLETNFATKNMLESDLYNSKQEILKEVDNKLKALKNVLSDISQRMDTIKLANEDDVVKLGQDLRAVTNVLWKKLYEEKTGLERAMEELGKLSLPKPEGVPEEESLEESEGESEE